MHPLHAKRLFSVVLPSPRGPQTEASGSQTAFMDVRTKHDELMFTGVEQMAPMHSSIPGGVSVDDAAPSSSSSGGALVAQLSELCHSPRLVDKEGRVVPGGDRWQILLHVLLPPAPESECPDAAASPAHRDEDALARSLLAMNLSPEESRAAMQWLLFACTMPDSSCPAEVCDGVYAVCRCFCGEATAAAVRGRPPKTHSGPCPRHGIHYQYAHYQLVQWHRGATPSATSAADPLTCLEKFCTAILLDLVADGCVYWPTNLGLLLDGLRQLSTVPANSIHSASHPFLFFLTRGVGGKEGGVDHVREAAEAALLQIRSTKKMKEAVVLFWGLLQAHVALDGNFVSAAVPLSWRCPRRIGGTPAPSENPGQGGAEAEEKRRFSAHLQNSVVLGAPPCNAYAVATWLAWPYNGEPFTAERWERFWEQTTAFMSFCRATAEHRPSFVATLLVAHMVPVPSATDSAPALRTQRLSLAAWITFRAVHELRKVRRDASVDDWVAATARTLQFIHELLLLLSPSLALGSHVGCSETDARDAQQDLWSIILSEGCRGVFATNNLVCRDASSSSTRWSAPQTAHSVTNTCDLLRDCVFPYYHPRLWRATTVNLYVHLLHEWGHSIEVRRVFQVTQRRETDRQQLIRNYLRQQKQQHHAPPSKATPTSREEMTTAHPPSYRPALSLNSCEVVITHCRILEDADTAGMVIAYMLLTLHARALHRVAPADTTVSDAPIDLVAAGDEEVSDSGDSLRQDPSARETVMSISRPGWASEVWLEHIQAVLIPHVTELYQRTKGTGLEHDWLS